MGSVAESIKKFSSALPQGVKLVAVSKFQPVEAIQEAYEAGQRIFGESRAQELAQKAAALPGDIEWHFIGHLQTNKVKQVIPHISLMHSMDSHHLLRAIQSEAEKLGIVVPVLMQVHVAAEQTKFGFYPDELLRCAAQLVPQCPNVEVRGIMGMATNTDDMERVARDFDEIRHCSQRLQSILPQATEVSMGMSGDYELALEYGSTMVRIGSSIFGEREY